jgi:hypothetical protein
MLVAFGEPRLRPAHFPAPARRAKQVNAFKTRRQDFVAPVAVPVESRNAVDHGQ